jgi:hypothetical protein
MQKCTHRSIGANWWTEKVAHIFRSNGSKKSIQEIYNWLEPVMRSESKYCACWLLDKVMVYNENA